MCTNYFPGFGILIAIYSFLAEQEPLWLATGWSLWVTVSAAMLYLAAMIVSLAEYCVERRFLGGQVT